MATSVSTWHCKPNEKEQTPGAQIDMIIERADRMIHLLRNEILGRSLSYLPRLREKLRERMGLFKYLTANKKIISTYIYNHLWRCQWQAQEHRPQRGDNGCPFQFLTIMMIQQIIQRLSEVNTLLTTCRQDDFSFAQALTLSLFYRDFSDTNSLVGGATLLAKENPGQLSELSSSLISKRTDTCRLTGRYCRPWISKRFLKNTSGRLSVDTKKPRKPPQFCGRTILR